MFEHEDPPSQPFDALSRHHVRGLADRHIEVLAARLAYNKLALAGKVLGYSEQQMRRRWVQTRELILVPLALPAHDDLLCGLWVAAHRQCCLQELERLIGSDSRFCGKFLAWR